MSNEPTEIQKKVEGFIHILGDALHSLYSHNSAAAEHEEGMYIDLNKKQLCVKRLTNGSSHVYGSMKAGVGIMP